ncbi:MAG: hypothetical protein ACKVQJ_06560 [Pyrinomonadaceae bacterium]
MKIFTRGMIFLAAIFTVGALSLAADAQTTKTRAKPLATPLPTLSGAEIISRADDYLTVEPVKQPATKTSTNANVNAARIKELTDRINKLESTQKSDYDEKQKRMLLNLDILTRAEQRAESLRKQLFEMIEKENSVKSRLDQIETDSRPEMIERTLQLAGSMKPEEIRDIRRKSLANEKTNLQALLFEIQNTRSNITVNLQKADLMVEKLRIKLEKDIEDSFLKDDEPEN